MNLFLVLQTSTAIGTASYIVAHARISLPFRRWVEDRSIKATLTPNRAKGLRASARWEWLGDLIGCPLCVSVWLSFGAVGAFPQLWDYPVGAAQRPMLFLVYSFSLIPGAMVTVVTIKLALGHSLFPKD